MLFGRYHHCHQAAFGFWLKFNLGGFFKIFFNPRQQITAQAHMGHFAASKADGDFYFIAAVYKFLYIAGFDQIIMGVDIWAHFYFFELLGFLPLFIGGLFLLCFEPHFTVVQNFTHGQIRAWGYFNQIKFDGTGMGKRVVNGDNPFFFTGFCYEKDFGRRNFVVNARASFFGRRGVWSAGYVGLRCSFNLAPIFWYGDNMAARLDLFKN